MAGRVNASARNSTSGSVLPMSASSRSQNAQRLGVRVVDAEDPHPVVHPQPHDAQHLGVDALGVVVEVERVDVLVALGRVLRVGDRAVGPGGEPLRVLGHPRVVGRGLQRQVERHLQAQLAGPRDERVEVRHRAEVRVDGVVPAVRRADRPRRARVAGPGVQRVVPALAGGRADRVDRRQVHHVEAHLRDGVQPARPRCAACRTRGSRRSVGSSSAPSERGKNSYQAPNSARCRCTISGYRRTW